MREQEIQRQVMLALSEAGCLAWRCNTGTGWQGKMLHQAQGQVTLGDCRPLHAGLTKGGADLIGVAPGGRFLAVEIKTPSGRVSRDQEKFLLAVNRAGGLGFVARSADDALDALRQAGLIQ